MSYLNKKNSVAAHILKRNSSTGSRKNSTSKANNTSAIENFPALLGDLARNISGD